ncbi:photosystem reaction center subunit H [Methanocella sp. CWC-04]|uniref:Photosystem reaction center subunit H n=1 Tax=Methanooceanicella nereidis TaxID=2052831 RepID=A0AAP2W5P6_9EURY|nr:PRC-barrel domain-containing protein [Methanocella sp. CWC-04]MCD1294538.1 photosystem reaction center subunit H [Methanocella sp. CWC-04]
MVKIMAKKLSNKKVMGTDGSEMGILYNITVDLRTGDLVDLLIRPDMTLNVENYRMEDGLVHIPFTAVRAVKDFIVVDKKASTI